MNLLANRLKLFVERLPYVPRGLALAWQATRQWTVLWGLLTLAQAAAPAAMVVVTRQAVNSIVTLLSQRSAENLLQAGTWVGALAAIMLATEVARGLTQWAQTVQSELIKAYLDDLVHAQSSILDLEFYETPQYYDQLHRVRFEASSRIVTLVEQTGNLAQNVIVGLSIGVVLAPYGLWLPVVVLISAAPALFAVVQRRLREHEWWLRSTHSERRGWYYYWLLTDASVASEVRLFDLGSHVRQLYQALQQKRRAEFIEMARSHVASELGASLLSLVALGAVMLWMVWRGMNGFLTLGDIALFYQAFQQGQSAMRAMLQAVGELYSNSLFLTNLFEFLALKPKISEPLAPIPFPSDQLIDIRFRGVTFRYPDSDRPIFENLTAEIPAGKLVAVVGSNGSGKSTIIKLVCRLYDPQAGQIEINGVDIRRYSVAELRKHITAIFQVPVHFNDTVTSNIAMGRLSRQTDSEAIQVAAKLGSADEIINRLPHGYETLLGKWFVDGSELSVGEWQRVALARALLRTEASLVILDEPTSAMDPWAELDWMTHLRTIAQGRTVLMITHRINTAISADVIYVMQSGRFVETGTHERLIAVGGHYARLWKAQTHAASSANASHSPLA